MCLGSSTAITSLNFYQILHIKHLQKISYFLPIIVLCTLHLSNCILYKADPSCSCLLFQITFPMMLFLFCFQFCRAHWIAPVYELSYINILARLHATCAAPYQTDSFSTDIKLSPPALSRSSLSEETDAGHSSTDSTGQLSPAGQPQGLQGPARSLSGLSRAQQVTCRKMFRGNSPAVSVQQKAHWAVLIRLLAAFEIKLQKKPLSAFVLVFKKLISPPEHSVYLIIWRVEVAPLEQVKVAWHGPAE